MASHSRSHRCPAMLISAPASAQGKTTITAALAYYHRQNHRRVTVFKIGPDFIDPQIQAFASGQTVYQLDLWMMGESHCRALLYQAAQKSDLILIEGAMGLFDGSVSSADFALLMGVPIAVVIDAQGMAQTFAAVAFGLANYRPQLSFAGVIANKVGSLNHAKLLEEALPDSLPLLSVLPRDADIALPSRHLGLLQANEITDLQTRLQHAANLLTRYAPCHLPPVVDFVADENSYPDRLLQNQRIAVAHDKAFSFIYPANLDWLQAMGAELMFFSALEDTALPVADSLYLPGGYPELYLSELAANTAMKQAIRAHHQAGKPIYAECGGFLYLLQSLADQNGHEAEMVGLLAGTARMQKKLVNLGMQSLEIDGAEIRGHTFHHSQLQTSMTPYALSKPQHKRGQSEALFRCGNLQAGYLHHYFPSCPKIAAGFFL